MTNSKAVRRNFPTGHQVHKGRHREYTLRTADAGSGERYRLAIMRQVEQGNGDAQETARDLIDDLVPSLVLVVGIAGGLPSEDICLGDVVIATRIADFSLEVREFQGATAYNIGGGPIPKSIATYVPCIRYVSKTKFVHDVQVESTVQEIATRYY